MDTAIAEKGQFPVDEQFIISTNKFRSYLESLKEER